ncbi:hypothetical protein BC831DRAFT_442758, partial [Entophlyctis helioformis]
VHPWHQSQQPQQQPLPAAIQATIASTTPAQPTTATATSTTAASSSRASHLHIHGQLPHQPLALLCLCLILLPQQTSKRTRITLWHSRSHGRCHRCHRRRCRRRCHGPGFTSSQPPIATAADSATRNSRTSVWNLGLALRAAFMGSRPIQPQIQRRATATASKGV